jgi:hypothetical protein
LLEEIRVDFGKSEMTNNLIDPTGSNDQVYARNVAALEEV